MMRYEANKNNVSIWITDSELPQLIQSTWPDGTPWSSDKEAEDWAKAEINYFKNPESASIRGGFSPKKPTRPKPEPEPKPEPIQEDDTVIESEAITE